MAVCLCLCLVLRSDPGSYDVMYRVETVMSFCLLVWILTNCGSVLYVLMLVGMFKSVSVVYNVS